MSHENENLRPLEQALAGFTPAPPQLDRDRLMFLAGQANATASGRREPPDGLPSSSDQAIGKLTHPARRGANWLWPASTATLAATSLALAIALFARPAPQPLFVVREATPPSVQPPQATAERDVPPPHFAAAVPPRHPATTDSYLKTREVALRMGLDAIGSPGFGGSQATSATYLELLEGLTQAAPAAVAAPSAVERSPNM